MSAREDALIDIAETMRRHGLSLDDIARALEADPGMRAGKSAGALTRILSYVGGILVFAGLCIFAGMAWDDLGPAGRVAISLEPGFCAFLAGVAAARGARHERAATPLFLVAAAMQPAGILVALHEYASGGEPLHGLLFMTFTMTAQQGLCFIALRRTVLAFTTSFFGAAMFVTACDILGVDGTLAGFTAGLSLLCIGWALGRSRHHAVAPLHYLPGSVLVLCAVFDWVEKSAAEALFLGLSVGFIYLSTLARSRTLLVVGTLSAIFYIGYFSAEHFEDALGWPVLLILMGLVLMGLSAAAVGINKKYIAG